MPYSSRVLLLSNDEAEANRLRTILTDRVALTHVRELRDLQGPSVGSYDALFCAWSFKDGAWIDALREVRECSPDLPVIVLSRIGGEHEWIEVLEAGAFDLLTPPYQEHMLLAVLEQALASREARVSQSASGNRWKRAG